MAQPAGTFDTYDAKGLREDLSNVIYTLSPDETPFISNIGRVKVSATKHEWQVDAIGNASTANAQVQGDEFSYSDPTATTRVGNFTQISTRTAQVSNTLEAVQKAGRDKEMAYQMALQTRRLKIDMEAILLSNQASVAGTNAVAPKLGGLPSWLTTNVSRGATGSSGGYNTGTGLTVAATPGTQRALSEDQVKDVMQAAWNAGGSPSILMLGAFNKRKASTALTGIADIRKDAPGSKAATVIGSVETYVSDFGNISIVPNRYIAARDAFLLDPEFAALGQLRAPKVMDPAVTGDYQRKVILAEYTLIVKNEAAHGHIADLTTA
jgi:hypothetical protein